VENSDRLVSGKNQEISELNSRLAAANQKIADRDAEIERLESELDQRSGETSEDSAPIAIGGELPESADLLNQLKARRKKSTVTLPDIKAILEMIEESWGHNC